MYSILFHVTGIAILEICFFFYYVGPMETQMFEKTVRKLANGPIQSLDTLLIQNQITPQTIQYITGALFGETVSADQSLELQLYNKSIEDRIRRMEKNQELFIQTIEYWGALAFMSILVFLAQCKYHQYQKMQKERGLNQEIEMGDCVPLRNDNPRSYRKGSIDEDTSPSYEEPCISTKHKDHCWKMGHYALFGSCIICFQYMFFQNIVFYYDPLSKGEVNYLIYQSVQPEL